MISRWWDVFWGPRFAGPMAGLLVGVLFSALLVGFAGAIVAVVR